MWIEGAIKPWTTEYIIQRAKDDKEIKELVDNQMRIMRKKYNQLIRKRIREI